MTAYTDNYKLPLYEGADKPNLADQYAEAMRLLDTALTAAQAARTELQNSVNALNTNLAATNTQVEAALANSALAKTDAANAVSVSQAAANTANAAGAEVAALKTDVTTNKALVEEHVNYFADLEITDEESAQDVNTKINNAFSGTMSNTQAITALNSGLTEVNTELKENNDYTIFDVGLPTTPEGLKVKLYAAVNKTKTAFKFFGDVYNALSTSISIARVPIPGSDSRYGIKTNVDTGLRPAAARLFQYTNVYWNNNSLTIGQTFSSTFALGTDGYIYLWNSSSPDNVNLVGPSYYLFFQVPLFLGSGDWPSDTEQER